MTDFPPPPPPPPPAPPPGGYQQYGYGYGVGAGAFQYAGFWIRFAAAILDGLILAIPFVILNVAFYSNFTLSMGAGVFAGEAALVALLRNIVTAIYYAVLEGGPSGQTIGKRVCSIRVVDAETIQPGIGSGRAFGRYLMSLVSGLALGLGYLWMLWDSNKQTWHDKVVRSYVIRA